MNVVDTHGNSGLVTRLLRSRGIETSEAQEKFLNPDYDTHLHSPFLLTDMQKGAERILFAMRNNEHLIIYTDYDCDGIPGGVLLHDDAEYNFQNLYTEEK